MEDKPNFSSYDYETLLDAAEHIDVRQYPERKKEVEGLALGEPSPFQRLAATAILVWASLESITMLFHDHHRALHDLITGTIVANELPPEK